MLTCQVQCFVHERLLHAQPLSVQLVWLLLAYLCGDMPVSYLLWRLRSVSWFQFQSACASVSFGAGSLAWLSRHAVIFVSCHCDSLHKEVW